MKSKIIIGTKDDKLALIQTNKVIDELKKYHHQLEIDIKIIKTPEEINNKNLFIKKIEELLINKEIDLAVHQIKNVPHTLPEGVRIGAVLKRESPQDVLILLNNYNLTNLPIGAIIGTNNIRRTIQIQNVRSDIKIMPITGDIDAKINKLGEYDGVILSLAELKCYGLNENKPQKFFKRITNKYKNLNLQILKTEEFVPAVGQGAIGIEIRKKDEDLYNIVSVLHNNNDAICIATERAFLREIDEINADSVGACAILKDEEIIITGFIGDSLNSTVYKEILTGNKNFNRGLGIELARKLKQKYNNKTS